MEFVKRFIKKAFHIFGVDIRQYTIQKSDELLLDHIIRHFKVETIFDVGANIGQYASKRFEEGYQGRILSFEPISNAFAELTERSKGRSKWEVFNVALGSSHRSFQINVSDNVVSSSLYAVSEQALAAEPRTKIVRKEAIQLTTLDSFLDTNKVTAGVTLLKLDVQGYELEVLKGASESLQKIKIIQAELSFVPNYEGAPLYDEVMRYLRDRSYILFTIMPGFRDPHTGQMLQADGIFVRA